MKQLRRLLRREEGVGAVEFAMIAPVVLLLLFGIIEFSLVMVVYNVMEGATAVSSRLGKTGFVAAGTTRQATILQAIKDRAGSLIDSNQLTMTSKFYKQYDQINDPEPYIDANHNGLYNSPETYTDINGNGHWDADMASSGYGSAGDVVVYTVTYPWPISTPIMRQFLGTNGTFMITTHAVVKNEPY
ncbi:MAG: TadE/TadG family type IV pilus assembly protein [Rickettsiales bacterium]